jgi:Copper transport outer membrane protein, MctB
MGYSGRYHAASLVAVFIALAIGILIGVGLADDVVSTASQELENSLRSDLADATSQADGLEQQLGRERDFGERIYPALVSGRLAGSSIAVVGFGELSDETVADIEAAVEPAGASVEALAVVEVPPDPGALATAAGPRYAGARRGGEELERLGRSVGGGLIGGSKLLSDLRGTLFSRFSGALTEVDRVVFAGAIPEDLDAKDQANTTALLRGITDGARSRAAGTVAVERTAVEPSSLQPFRDAGIATVDHIDLVAGRVATVFSLLGADGDYGIKAGADRFLPELISPASGRPIVP